MRKFLPDFEFTPIEEGLSSVVEWLEKNWDEEGVVRK
jgi:hypothetical protein